MRQISDERSLALIRTRAAAMRAAVVPDWLAELVRPKPAPWPWPDMIRAALACWPAVSGWAVRQRKQAARRRAFAVAGPCVVGLAGFEPAASATQTRRASQTALQPVLRRV